MKPTAPRITIVTPSFNQAQYLEQTIDSVLSQGYPNLEYMVIDGGSCDGSTDILRRYEHHLAYWVSEPDRGQTHAINKGMNRATGEIRAYLNSDDYYLPGTFSTVSEFFSSNSDTDLLHGRCRHVDERGGALGSQYGSISTYDDILDVWNVWWKKRQFVQPEVFWTDRIARRIGPFREDLHYVMDYDYWLRMLKAGGKVARIDRELACFRKTAEQKSTHRTQVAEELLSVVQSELWDTSSPIAPARRRRLQGQWLYQQVFCRESDQLVRSGRTSLERWARLSWLAVRHPQLFQADGFRRRALRRWKFPAKHDSGSGAPTTKVKSASKESI